MLNILFINGLGATSNSPAGAFFESLNTDEVKFFHPTFSISPRKALQEVNQFIHDNQIEMVIGISMGGFYALVCDCDVGIVINPAMTPISDISKNFKSGEPLSVDGKSYFTLDESFYLELHEILLNQSDDPNNWFKSFPKHKSFAGIFGKEDELFRHGGDFKYISDDITYVEGMGHLLSSLGRDYLITIMRRMTKKHFSTDISSCQCIDLKV